MSRKYLVANVQFLSLSCISLFGILLVFLFLFLKSIQWDLCWQKYFFVQLLLSHLGKEPRSQRQFLKVLANNYNVKLHDIDGLLESLVTKSYVMGSWIEESPFFFTLMGYPPPTLMLKASCFILWSTILLSHLAKPCTPFAW